MPKWISLSLFKKTGHHAGKKKNTRSHPESRRAVRKHTPTQKNLLHHDISEYSLKQGLRAWLRHHRFSCVDSLMRLLKTPGHSIMTWMVIAIALVLPAILYLGLGQLQQLGQHWGWQGAPKLSAYVVHKTAPAAIEHLQQRLSAHQDIQSVVLITPEQGRQEFHQHGGLGDLLQLMDDNPLPAVLLLTPAAAASHPNHLQQLQQTLLTDPLIESVQVDIDWLWRLHEMTELAYRVVLLLTVLLVLGVLLIIGNTIRLAIENRHREIRVVKMVGATDSFVKRPFLYSGLWYGMGGGVMALLLLLLAQWWLTASFQRLLALYESEYTLGLINSNISLFLIVGAAVTGWLGAWLAVYQHLRDLEPK